MSKPRHSGQRFGQAGLGAFPQIQDTKAAKASAPGRKSEPGLLYMGLGEGGALPGPVSQKNTELL